MSTETVILELNQNFSDGVIENGNYHITLANPVQVNPGDVMEVRMASIDSQKSDSNTIVFPEETPVSISYSYYDVDFSAADKYELGRSNTWLTGPGPTFKYFSGYSSRTMLQLDGAMFQCTQANPGGGGGIIPSPPTIVNLNIQFNFIGIDGKPATSYPEGTGPAGSATNYYLSTDDPTTKSLASCGLIGNGRKIKYLEGTLEVVKIIGSLTELTRPIPGYNPKDVHQFPEEDATTTLSSGTRQLDIQNTTITIPAGRWDQKSLAVYMTQELTYSKGVLSLPGAGGDQFFIPENPLLLRTDDELVGANLVWNEVTNTASGERIIFDTGNTYEYWTGTSKPKYMMGASILAMEFGQVGNVFSMSYAHTPVFNGADIGKQNIAYYQSGTPSSDLRYHQITAETGIVIHEMTPQTLWEDSLGLYNQLKVQLNTDPSGINYFQLNEMLAKTPTGFAGINTFMPTGNRVITDPLPHNPTYVDIDGQTKSIIGNPLRANSTGGYYLVEILSTIPNTTYLDSEQDRSFINAIVSKQYDNDDIVTGFRESAIPYEHRGAPFMLSEAKVQILDAKTKQIATGLGSNNTIFLEITKNVVIPDLKSKK